MPMVIKFTNGLHSVRNGSVIELACANSIRVSVTGFNKNFVIAKQLGSKVAMYFRVSDFASDLFIQ